MKMRNVAVYIDGENMSARKAKSIFEQAGKYGKIKYAKVYRRESDVHTKRWRDKANEFECLEEIRVSGKATKNKIDNCIKGDMVKDTKRYKDIDVIVVVSSDHGYSTTIRELEAQGKEVNVIGGMCIARQLTRVCTMYACI